MPATLKLITPPTAEPITLDEAKAHLRVYSTDEDAIVASKLAAARRLAEDSTGRQLMTATWELTLDTFPGDGLPSHVDVPIRMVGESTTSYEARKIGIRLRRSPVASVTSIQYIATDGTLTTLASSEYSLVRHAEPGLLVPAYGKDWPSTRDEPAAVRVVFVAGYTSAALVPEPIKSYILLVLTDLYEHREPTVVGTISSRLEFADRLLDEWTVR